MGDYYPYPNETLKEESAIFKELMNHCISITIASYGFYKLSVIKEGEKETSSLIIDFEEEKKQEDKDKNTDTKEDQDRIVSFFNSIGAIKLTKDKKDSTKEENEKQKIELEKQLKLWNEKLNEGRFMRIALSMIERSESNFDDYFTKKSFEKYLFLISKLLDNNSNIEMFYKEGGFKSY